MASWNGDSRRPVGFERHSGSARCRRRRPTRAVSVARALRPKRAQFHYELHRGGGHALLSESSGGHRPSVVVNGWLAGHAEYCLRRSIERRRFWRNTPTKTGPCATRSRSPCSTPVGSRERSRSTTTSDNTGGFKSSAWSDRRRSSVDNLPQERRITRRYSLAALGLARIGRALPRGWSASGRRDSPGSCSRGGTACSTRRRYSPWPDSDRLGSVQTSVRPPLSSVMSRRACAFNRSPAAVRPIVGGNCDSPGHRVPGRPRRGMGKGNGVGGT